MPEYWTFCVFIVRFAPVDNVGPPILGVNSEYFKPPLCVIKNNLLNPLKILNLLNDHSENIQGKDQKKAYR